MNAQERTDLSATGRNGIGRRLSAGLIAVGLLVALLPAAAHAVVLSPTASPLAGSNFQGGDGDQLNASPLIDWQDLAASPDLSTVSDPDPDATTIKGKENAPVDWELNAGSSPGKTNFQAAWSILEGGTFLDLAFDRESSGGNAFLAFELNQDSRLWTNNNGDQIPCRTDGDLIISYEIQNSNNVDVVTQTWVSDTVVSAAQAAGPYTNGEGCAKTGHFVDSDPGAANAQAAINYPGNPVAVVNGDGSVDNLLPRTPAAATFGSGLFGEAALNLGGIYAAANGSPCFSFGQISMHSRTARSSNAALADYISPIRTAVRNCTISGFKWSDINDNGVYDAGEPPIEGYKFYLDLNGNGALDPGEPTATSDVNGVYVFTNVAPGDYVVREAPDAEQDPSLQGYLCTFPSPCEHSASISATQKNSAGNDFGNFRSGPPLPAILKKIHYSLRFRYSDKHGANVVVARVFCHSVNCVLAGTGKLKIKPYGRRANHAQSFRLGKARGGFVYTHGRREAGKLTFSVPPKGVKAVKKAVRHRAAGKIRGSVDVQGTNTLQPNLNKKRFRDIKLFSGPRNPNKR